MQEFFGNKVVPAIMKFVSLKGVVALKDGLLYTMPLSIVGSVFLLLANFPVQAVVDWLSSMGWMDPLNQAYGATFNISALVAVVGIAYEYVKKEGYQALNAGVLGFVVFLITTNSFVVSESGEIVSNVIDKTWTAGQGMITAILIGLIVGWVYSWFMKHDIRIKCQLEYLKEWLTHLPLNSCICYYYRSNTCLLFLQVCFRYNIY